jgi:hypothetical protein
MSDLFAKVWRAMSILRKPTRLALSRGRSLLHAVLPETWAVGSLAATFIFALAGMVDPATAQSVRWDGTAPFCSGECGPNETEIDRRDTSPGSPPEYNGPQFGAACVTGSKALCQSTPGISCRWDGTAPFCDGSCGKGEDATPPEGASNGATCVTGSKAYCCHRTNTTGASRQALSANPNLVRYAAIWEKSQGPAWQARHGLTSAQYQREFDKLLAEGYRLIEVTGFGVGNSDRYGAIWEKSPGPAWQARHGLSAVQYQQEFDNLTRQGFRPVNISAYTVAGQDRYAAIFERRQGGAWVARHGLTSSQYQQEFDRLVSQGYRLLEVSGYTVGGKDHYAAIWEKANGPAWQARHGMTSDQFQAEFNRLGQQGYQLSHVRGWQSGNVTHFAAIWVKANGRPWVARHGILSDAYQEAFDARLKEGYRLRFLSGYNTFN